MADWRQAAREQLARQQAAAEQRSKELEEKRRQEEEAKRERFAKAFDLTPEEQAQLAPKPAPIFGGPSPIERETQAMAPKVEDQKQTDMQSTPGPGGMTSPVASSPSKTDTVKTTSQPLTAKEQTNIDKTLQDVKKLETAFGAKTDPSEAKADIKNLLGKLDSLKIPDLTPRQTEQFAQARADAYRAYQEKADRNDWLEVAQNLVGAITNFASAKSAMGTQFIGGAVPLKGIDYGARSERALKEYGAQLGAIGEQEKAAETAADRADRLKYEQATLEKATLSERLAARKEEVRQAEADAKQAGRDAVSLYGILQNNQRAAEHNLTVIENALLRNQVSQGKVTEDARQKQINELGQLEKQLTNQLSAANQLIAADSKHYDKELSDFATSQGTIFQDVMDKAKQESGTFQSKKDYIKETLAPNAAKTTQQQLAEVRAQIAQLKSGRPAVTPSGQQSAAAQATPSTTTAQVTPDLIQQYRQKNPGLELTDSQIKTILEKRLSGK